MNAEIKINAKNATGSTWKFDGDTKSIRVCLEISTPKEYFSDAKERIYWQGTVAEGKFDDPVVMKKGLKIRTDADIASNIDDFWLLCSMPGVGARKDKFLVKDSQ